MITIEIKKREGASGATEFYISPEHIHLGGRASARVDALRFALPTEWVGKVVTVSFAPAAKKTVNATLPEDCILPLCSAYTADGVCGELCVRATGADGYDAYTVPAMYTVYHHPEVGDPSELPPDRFAELVKQTAEAAAQAAEDVIAGDIELVKIVTELPAEGEENKTYFVAKTDGEGNDLYDEYMWISGAWEYIGTKRFEIDLTDYVKRTDYASGADAGVVKVHPGYGLNVSSAGIIYPYKPDDNAIKNRQSNRIVVLEILDKAVKEAIATNTETLTDEEKAAALAWLGAVGAEDYATTDKAGVVKTTYRYGIFTDQNGFLTIFPASTEGIDGKSVKNPITPSNLDYAIKVGLTTNTNELTNDEKLAACAWLGAVKLSNPASGLRLFAANNEKQTYFDLTNVGCLIFKDNAIRSVEYATNEARPYSFVQRSANGVIYTGDPTENRHAATKKYVDNLAVDRSKGVVSFDTDGNQESINWAYNTQGNSIARRLGNGTLHVATPDVDNAAANKGYVDGLIASLEERIAALEGGEGV